MKEEEIKKKLEEIRSKYLDDTFSIYDSALSAMEQSFNLALDLAAENLKYNGTGFKQDAVNSILSLKLK